MDDEQRLIGVRIAQARRVAGLTQRELAERLGVTVRSIQNYESGAIVPYRHLARIESVGNKRPGWLLAGEGTGDEPQPTLQALHHAMQQHQALLEDHLQMLRRQTELLSEQRRTNEERRARRGQ